MLMHRNVIHMAKEPYIFGKNRKIAAKPGQKRGKITVNSHRSMLKRFRMSNVYKRLKILRLSNEIVAGCCLLANDNGTNIVELNVR